MSVKHFFLALIMLLSCLISGCGGDLSVVREEEALATSAAVSQGEDVLTTSAAASQGEDVLTTSASASQEEDVLTTSASASQEEDVLTTSASANQQEAMESQEETEDKTEDNDMKIQVGNVTFSVTLENNSSAEALKEYLKDGEVTLALSDYAGMEKVGGLGTVLPRNDQQIDTVPGDIILYQGNQFVFYYGTNSWSLTRLGKVNNATAAEIRAALGSGDVQVTLSLY